LISGSDSADGRVHPWFQGGIFGLDNDLTVSPDMLELTDALSERSGADIMGYDAVARWNVKRKIIAAAGLPETWGQCGACAGGGIAADSREAYEAWKPVDPPTGAGWQMWENVSEGSPISPVFATPEELARHMAARPWGIQRGSYGQWLSVIKSGTSTLSMVMRGDGQMLSGVEAAAELAGDDA